MRTRWSAASSVTVWAAATLAGMAVCWLGVRPVLAAVVPDRLVAFPATEPAPQVTMLPGGPPSTSPSRHPTPSRSPSRSVSPGTPSASAPVVVDGWTRFGDGQYTSSFQLVGGTATVQASNGTVELLSATPKPGFVMAILPTASDRVVVNFTGGGLHISTLEARWRDDAPVATVTELP